MEIIVKYGPYNQRRFSKPWIGKVVDWPAGKMPVLEFGIYLGNDRGGEVNIIANAGDIVRHGQKDYRGKHTEKDWYIVQPDGNLENTDAAGARKQWIEHHGPPSKPQTDKTRVFTLPEADNV